MTAFTEGGFGNEPALSYDQKVAVALNDLPAAGLPGFVYTDGPNGIRGANGATAFPSGLAVAASFDVSLAERFGEALGREALAAGRNAILAPGLDIARVPWAGRIAEALGEDPVLVGDIGAGVVRGIQRIGVLAVPKHFIANNFEVGRTGFGALAERTPAVDIHVSPRALREIYAEPFRRALAAGAGAILSSYNRVDGEYVSENADVLGILRDEWGWPGFVTPDFLWAVRDDRKALLAGLDFPALGGTAHRTEEMVHSVGEDHLDQIVARTRWAVHAAQVHPAPISQEPLDDPQSQDLAQEILEKGSVLLTNDGILPLRRGTSVALVGIADPSHLLVMGGSAAVTLSPDRIRSVADSLLHADDRMTVTLSAGTRGDIPLPPMTLPVSARVTHTNTGESADMQLDTFEIFTVPTTFGEDWSATLTAMYHPAVDGPHRLSVTFGGEATLYVDDVPVASGYREASPMVQGPEYPVQAVVDMRRGRPVRIRADYTTGPAFRIPGAVVPGVKVGLAAPDGAIETAAATAAAADAAVIIVGRVSGEAMDVDGLRLPGDQEDLIRAVTAANPRTVVVTCGAGPVVMPWLKNAAAVLHVWNPGERFGPALANILTGAVEPGGRLPLTIPAQEDRTPVSTPEQYPGVDGVAQHSEDLLVGYRWYHATGEASAFSFGHGLGFAAFDVIEPRAAVEKNTLTATATACNTGRRSGSTVVQVYITTPSTETVERGLKGFVRTGALAAGNSTPVAVSIDLRDLAVFDPDSNGYVLRAGRYVVEFGLSSTDIRKRVELTLAPRTFTHPSTLKPSE